MVRLQVHSDRERVATLDVEWKDSCVWLTLIHTETKLHANSEFVLLAEKAFYGSSNALFFC